MKRIIINESQYSMLNEGMSNILYHFTSLGNGYSICKEDKIYLQSAFAKDADNYDKKRKFYLSCTRVRSSQFGFSKKFSRGGVRIVLDGNLLSNNFKGKQINYWNGLNDKYSYYQHFPKSKEEFDRNIRWYVDRYKKDNPNATPEDIQHFIDYNFNNDAQTHTDNESEDRIFSYDSVINDAHKYIKSVDVLIPGFDKDTLNTAAAFLYYTSLGSAGLVRIFDSVEEFNKPNGKDCNAKVEYTYDVGYSDSLDRNVIGKAKRCLEGVMLFIAFANPEFEGEKFGKAAMKYLSSYGLEEFKSYIGTMMDNRNRIWGGAKGVAEHLDAVRRDLSDTPNRYTAKIVKMMTDYFLNIGANTFREAYLKKSEMADEYYGVQIRWDEKIDSNIKYPFFVHNNTISLYPDNELFRDFMGIDDDGVKHMADWISYDVYHDFEHEKFTHNSKNDVALFNFLYKLFRTGTVSEAISALMKLGYNGDYLAEELQIKQVELNYWDIVMNYHTINSRKLENSTNEWREAWRLRDKEAAMAIMSKQKVS